MPKANMRRVTHTLKGIHPHFTVWEFEMFVAHRWFPESFESDRKKAIRSARKLIKSNGWITEIHPHPKKPCFDVALNHHRKVVKADKKKWQGKKFYGCWEYL